MIPGLPPAASLSEEDRRAIYGRKSESQQMKEMAEWADFIAYAAIFLFFALVAAWH